MASHSGKEARSLPSEQDCQGKSSVAPGESAFECRNVTLLAAIFSLYFAVRSGCLVVLPLASKDLLSAELGGAERSALYQLPLTLWMVLDVFLGGLIARVMQRYGRRRGFTLGASCCLTGAILACCTLAILHEDAWLTYGLLNLAVILISPISVGEFVRYAAAEAIHDVTLRARTVSFTIAGGAVASVVGPISSTVATIIDGGVPMRGYALFFLFMCGFCVMSFAAARGLRLPGTQCSSSPGEEKLPRASRTNLCSILKRGKVVTAIVAQVGVQFAMVCPMTAVPLAMQSSIPGLNQADWTISGCIMLHVFCMFVPGLLLGRLSEQIGVNPTIVTGLLLQTLGIAIAKCGISVAHFYISLALIGIGWNVAFVAGTLLLLRSHSEDERPQVTGLNESLRFCANAVAAMLSSTLSWQVLLTVCLVSLAVVATAVVTCWLVQNGGQDTGMKETSATEITEARAIEV